MCSAYSPLNGKHILVAVTGSIAAYKSAELVRRLKDHGAEVRVVMTQAATTFITPLTMQTLSEHPVALNLLDAEQESTMGHITLARWADWVLVAPASADTMARLTQGRADDLLSAIILATTARIAIAPAMNQQMWKNVATQDNLRVLTQRGMAVIGPASGIQACGEIGDGRMMSPDDIIVELSQLMTPPVLAGKTVMVTAGPTYEPIDPVRFLGNRSSGKMGYAVAQAAAEAGARVILISGPVDLATPSNVERFNVETAEQMLAAVEANIAVVDIFIGAAAVADYRPEQVATDKIKKQKNQAPVLALQMTPDILKTVANHSHRPAFVVGFAAETNSLEEYAQTKLKQKNVDMIAANDVSNGQVFGQADNALHVFWGTEKQTLPTASKTQLARDLIKLINGIYHAKNPA